LIGGFATLSHYSEQNRLIYKFKDKVKQIMVEGVILGNISVIAELEEPGTQKAADK